MSVGDDAASTSGTGSKWTVTNLKKAIDEDATAKSAASVSSGTSMPSEPSTLDSEAMEADENIVLNEDNHDSPSSSSSEQSKKRILYEKQQSEAKKRRILENSEEKIVSLDNDHKDNVPEGPQDSQIEPTKEEVKDNTEENLNQNARNKQVPWKTLESNKTFASLTAGSKDGDYTSFCGIMRVIKGPDGLLKCRIEWPSMGRVTYLEPKDLGIIETFLEKSKPEEFGDLDVMELRHPVGEKK